MGLLSKNIGIDQLDFPGPGATWTLGPRGLTADCILAWAGIREYPDPDNPGKTIRVFRDPAQLDAPGFKATLERMPAAIGHPRNPEGKWLFPSIVAKDPRGEAAPFASDAVLVPFKTIQVGSVGDRIEMVDGGEGLLVPKGRVTITDSTAALASLGVDQSGSRRDETSLAFVKHDIRDPGVWVDPKGEGHPYDVIQILDPSDSRVPDDLKKWIGAYYLGICFDRGQSRGGMTRFALDSQDPIASRSTGSPRTFFMYRQQDESGVSGKGHVLDGVIWPNGKMSFCWNSDASSVGSFDSYDDFVSKHVAPHPGNGTIITFDDGAPAPAIEPSPDAQDSAMNLEQALAMIEQLKQQLAALQAENEKLKTGGAASADDAKAKAEALAKSQQEVAAKQAAVDSLEAEVKPYREQKHQSEIKRCAEIVGIDSKLLANVKLSDIPVAAMRKHFELGKSTAPSAERLADDHYLRARFDIMAEQHAAGIDANRDTEASPEFVQGYSGKSDNAGLDSHDRGGDQPKPKRTNAIADLP